MPTGTMCVVTASPHFFFCRALLDVLSSVPPLLPPRSLEKAKTSPRGVPPGQLYTAARADSRLAMVRESALQGCAVVHHAGQPNKAMFLSHRETTLFLIELSPFPCTMQYLSDALGHLNLFLRVVSAIFQLPMAYGTDFRGVHSLVWTPTDHHASETAPPAHACSLRVHTSSGQQDAERAKNDWGAAVHATQRNAAIALCQYPQVCVSDSTLLSPMEWLVEVCCVLLEEGGGTECLGRSEAVCRLQTGTRRFSTQQYGGPLEEPEGQGRWHTFQHPSVAWRSCSSLLMADTPLNGAVSVADDREDEEGWELMAAGGESDFDIQDGGTSQYAIGAVVNRLRRLASNYRDAAV